MCQISSIQIKLKKGEDVGKLAVCTALEVCKQRGQEEDTQLRRSSARFSTQNC